MITARFWNDSTRFLRDSDLLAFLQIAVGDSGWNLLLRVDQTHFGHVNREAFWLEFRLERVSSDFVPNVDAIHNNLI